MRLDNPVDILWLLLCTALVLLMQLGFLLLEAGAVRAKNTVNVAVKNLADLALSSLLFWAFGFAVMFGQPFGLLWGSGPALDLGMLSFFLFQVAFCGTAATIVAGAVAERMSFRGYMLATLVIAGVIYPVVGSWAWGGLAGGAPGWLQAMGFVDFAGSTVVHGVGGWVALAAAMVIGPRRGRFGAGGRAIYGANLAMSAGGALVLWIGWFGFNGGSLLGLGPALGVVLLVTMLGGAAGGVMAALISLFDQGRVPPMGLANGVIGGLVAITAGAPWATPVAAVLLGAGGAVAASLGTRLLERWRIDDPVGAVPAHLVAGIFGTLSVAFLLPDTDPWRQLGVQTLGVVAAGLWAFPLAWGVLRVLDRMVRLRVSEDDEAVGLSFAEHGTVSAMAELLDAMTHQTRSGDFSGRVPVREGEEAGMVAHHYNSVLGRVQHEIAAREGMASRLADARDAAEAASRAKSEFLAMMSHELRTPLNGVLGLSAVLAGTDLDPRQGDLVRVLRESGQDLLGVLGDVLDIAEAEADGPRGHTGNLTLSALCETVSARFAPEAERKGLSFAIHCADAPATLRAGNADVFERILAHLTANAVKFTDRGGVSVAIEADRAIATLIVRDTGVGIPADRQARVFEPFTQGDSSETRRFGGAGLGLAVVKRLVGALGGSIALESSEGRGSVFVVRLPCPLCDSPLAARIAWPRRGAALRGSG